MSLVSEKKVVSVLVNAVGKEQIDFEVAKKVKYCTCMVCMYVYMYLYVRYVWGILILHVRVHGIL